MRFSVLAILLLATAVSARNPGYAIRITESGLNYAVGAASGVVDKIIEQIVIPPVHFKSSSVDLTISGVKVTKFDSDKWAQHLSPPNTVLLELSGANLDAVGKFTGKVLLSHVNGGISAKASGTTLQVSIALGSDDAGRPTVKETSCKASFGSFDIGLSGGTFVKIINWFHKAIANDVKPTILNELCTHIQSEVNTNLTKILATLPTTIDIGEHFGIDYRLLASPHVASSYAEIQGRGEIDFDGVNTDPFDAPPLDRSGATGSFMAYFWGSEYILDSAAYQLQRSEVLQLMVTKDAIPTLASLLATSCSGICIGNIVKEIGTEYPNTYTGLFLNSTQIPKITVAPGSAVLTARGSIDISVLENGTYSNLAGANLDLTADVFPAIQGTNITGKVSITELNLNQTYSDLLDPVNWYFLEHVAQNILQNEINQLLAKGIPIPAFDGFTFENPYLALKNHTIEVATNVHFTPQF